VSRIKRALLSVADKTGIEELAQGLAEMGISIVSSGGTARALSKSGIHVQTVSDVTGAPEMLDGRVKTLHPKIHGGILADRASAQHLAQLRAQSIIPIDLVVSNLYPFAATIAREDATEEDIIEQIDIGGPAMVRAAAKNHRWVAVVVNPERYQTVLKEMSSRGGALSDQTRAQLAAEAFAHTAAYDMTVARWMSKGELFPPSFLLALENRKFLRYGENPHQRGAFYYSGEDPGWKQVAGKELSYTNVLDFEAAWQLASDFEKPAAAIIKHTNPCGVATGEDPTAAFERALEADPRSAFGGIIAFNRQVNGTTVAKKINELRAHIVVAPGYAPETMKVLEERKNVVVIETDSVPKGLVVRSAAGGVLVQEQDEMEAGRDEMTVVSTKEPVVEDWDDLLFAWIVTRHVKSNSAVFANDAQAVGVGAGQMSRVEAVEIAARRAGDKAKGAVLATDGFFPFRDGLDAAVESGARAVIAPGGGVRDPEVIAAADEHGIPLVFAGRRHFRH
jgi:phosphoribosylaminoimidazolecarboxamide formyltransferase/IMP cyclohydrolase